MQNDGNFFNIEETRKIDLSINVAIPAGVSLVQGVPARGFPYQFQISNTLDIDDEMDFVQPTAFGDVSVRMHFVRDLPS